MAKLSDLIFLTLSLPLAAVAGGEWISRTSSVRWLGVSHLTRPELINVTYIVSTQILARRKDKVDFHGKN